VNPSQAIKVEDSIRKLCEQQQGVWFTVSKEMRPELRMIKIEISIKVDEKTE